MNTSLKATNVRFENGYLIVSLDDGRIIGTPLKWYKELANAPAQELEKWRFICDNTGIEWQNLDCHLSVESMLKHKVA